MELLAKRTCQQVSKDDHNDQSDAHRLMCGTVLCIPIRIHPSATCQYGPNTDAGGRRVAGLSAEVSEYGCSQKTPPMPEWEEEIKLLRLCTCSVQYSTVLYCWGRLIVHVYSTRITVRQAVGAVAKLSRRKRDRGRFDQSLQTTPLSDEQCNIYGYSNTPPNRF